jgi:pimeloyl-ACP methyl ester carboxylesterase
MIGKLSTAPWRGIRAIAGGTSQPGTEGRHTLNYREYRLNYEIYGSGDRVLVWLHGLLLDANLSRGLARALAARGNRVVLLDLLGHGRSEKPKHSSAHRMDLYAEQVLCLLDELGVDQVVLGGVSLGTNVSLLATVRAPERVRGLVLEMPVLESAAPAAALTFVPLLLEMHYAQAPLRLVSRVISRLPSSGIGPLDSLLSAAGSDPTEIAAVLHGVLLGPIAPTVQERRAITAPALVLGHGIDLIHSYADAKRLARQLPDARLIRTRTFAELWVTPARLTAKIADFLDGVWADGKPGNPVRPREAALSGLTVGRDLAGSSWPAAVGRGRCRSRPAPGRCRSRLPSGRCRSRLPRGRCRSGLPSRRCRSRFPASC